MLSTTHNQAATPLAQRFADLSARIAAAAAAAGRSDAPPLLLAVSKGQPAAVIREAMALGLSQFGENYVTEALPKMAELAAHALVWHFIGRIQSNKTRILASRFDWVHGIDRASLAQRLSEQRGHFQAPLNICLQVNVLAEASKGGVSPAELPALIEAVRNMPRLRLRGLMCMLPYAAPLALQHQGFAEMRRLLEQAVAQGTPLDTLSMGMSDDFEPAIAEGATLLRIGTGLFGERSAAAVGRALE